jgi:two-component system, LytTR family, sensor kinase
MPRQAHVPAAALFGIATAFGVSSTIQAHWLERLSGGQPSAWLPLLALNLTYWYVPAVLAPPIMTLALRYGLGRVRWPKQALVHAAGGLTYSLIHMAVLFAAKAALFAEGRPSTAAGLWMYAQKEYLKQLDWLLMTYLFLVGLAHALAYRRESEARALDAAQLETRLVQAQLQALQRQLHPHFLFNTLNTISALMRTNLNAADTMIDRLGDLLRLTLDTTENQVVPLKRELDVLQKYLEIEQTRFGPRLSVVTDIDPDTLDANVPNLLLQPLVENAVRHGIAPHARPGKVSIRSTRERSRLVIEIRDSGDGVSSDRLAALNRGIGLGNTRARLEHLYPSGHQFTFANVEGGFSVLVDIPCEIGPAADVFLEAGVA